METKSYLELFFNDTSNACYFVHKDSHEVAFINKVMEKKLRTYGDVIGKKCYKVIHNMENPCSFCPMDSLKDSEFIEQRIFNEVTRSYHRANSTVISVNNSKICACKYFVAFAQGRQERMTYDKAIGKCLEILNENSIEEGIDQLLALLGEFYRSDKAFIYELDPATQSLSSKWTWLKEESDTAIPAIKDLSSVQQFLQWLDHMDGNVTEIATSITYSENSLEEMLLAQTQVKSMSVIPIKNRIGKVVGFVGVTNRKGKELDDRLLKTIGRFVEERGSNQNVVKELKVVKSLDSQTGFYNRQRYMEFLQETEEEMPKSLGVIFIYMSQLRAVNEKHGFAEGNALIEKIAKYLKGHITEPFYRLTGEEFVCFVKECTEGDIFQRVTKIEEEIRLGVAPAIQIGAAWEENKINILQLVAEADDNIPR